MKVIPAPLEKTTADLRGQIDKLSPFYSHICIDIVDGKLFPNSTLELQEALNIASDYPDFTFDLDLMVEDYSTALSLIGLNSQKLKLNTVFLHSKAKPDPSVFQKVNQGFNLGLAIDPDDSIDTIKQKFQLNSIPLIQIMTVSPGLQGQSFLPEMLNKIEQLRNLDYRNPIYIDGGVNDGTIPLIQKLQYKPDAVNIGSYFNRAGNLQDHVQYLSKVLSYEGNND